MPCSHTPDIPVCFIYGRVQSYRKRIVGERERKKEKVMEIEREQKKRTEEKTKDEKQEGER